MAREITFGVLPFFKGAYQSGIKYSKQNQVTYQGSTYQSKEDNNNTIPADELGRPTAKWDCVAKGYTDKQLREEINEYNISHINKTTYTLQEAISALNEYLGDGSRTIGLKMTYVDSASNKAKTYTYQGGSFVTTSSWSDEPDGGYLRKQAEAIGGVYDEKTNTWFLNKVSGITTKQIEHIVAKYSTLLNGGIAHDMDIVALPPITYSSLELNLINLDLSGLFRSTGIRVINLSEIISSFATTVIITKYDFAFNDCNDLVEITTPLNISTISVAANAPFLGCRELRNLKLFGLKTSLDVSNSPKLNVAQDGEWGLGYIIKNAQKNARFSIVMAKSIETEHTADIEYWRQYIIDNDYQITLAFA